MTSPQERNAPESDPHAQLVAQASAGDPRAVADLLERHMPSLMAYVRLKAGPLVRSKESVSDVMQSVCREVLADAGSFRYQGTAQFRQWLFTQALHKIHNKHRLYRAARRDALREAPRAGAGAGAGESAGDGLDVAYATLCTPSRHAVGREALADFERAFQSLPEEQREAVLLRRVVGLDYKDIAEQLGKSEGAARNLVYRGVARLAALTRPAQD